MDDLSGFNDDSLRCFEEFQTLSSGLLVAAESAGFDRLFEELGPTIELAAIAMRGCLDRDTCYNARWKVDQIASVIRSGVEALTKVFSSNPENDEVDRLLSLAGETLRSASTCANVMEKHMESPRVDAAVRSA